MYANIIAVALAATLGVSTAATASTTIQPLIPTTEQIVCETPLWASATIEADCLPKEPMTQESFNLVWDYAVQHNCDMVTLHYDTPITEELRDVIRVFINTAGNKYRYTRPEDFNYIAADRYSFRSLSDGTFDVLICFAPVDETVTAQQRVDAYSMAAEIYAGLRASGALTDTMTETERAKTILNWVTANTEYRDEGTALCHTAYSVFSQGSGVCDAYSGAYQILLRMDGIECYGVKGRSRSNNAAHAWSRVLLDGVWVNVDSCWCDDTTGGNTTYFALSDEELAKTHIW